MGSARPLIELSMALVQTFHEDAATFHDRRITSDTPAAAWVLDVTRPALVLGSRQNLDLVDVDECSRRDIDIVMRRSGGGVVLVQPGAQLWIDVVVPAEHPDAIDDVRASMIAFGSRWRSALTALQFRAPTELHRAMAPSKWSDLVCFDGLGPGELTVAGAKLVGVSQRRTRHGARFQSMMYRRDVRSELVGLLRADLVADDLAAPSLADESVDVVDVARLLAPR